MENEIINNLLNQDFFELSLFINNICNLRCKHCYVGMQNVEEDVSFDRWKEIVDESYLLGARIFGIVGKEPLLDAEKTFGLIKHIKQKKKVITGFVTNGLLLDKYSEEISKMDFDYLDVSIDGLAEEHDFIRGEGNFRRSLIGILNLIKSGFPKEKIFLSVTLTRKTNLLEMINFFEKIGIINFVISPYENFVHNSKELVSDTCEFFDRLMEELKILRTKNKVNLLVKSDYDHMDLLKYFLKTKLINLENLKEDIERNIIFTEHVINNLHVYFNFLPFSTELIREIRITSDGYVLSCRDQGYPDYKERAIGNIKTSSLKEILKSDLAKEKAKQKLEKNIAEIQEVFC